MVDNVSIQGNYPTGEPFKFTLDGAATYEQMQRLIELTSKVAAKAVGKDPAELKRIEAIRDNTSEVQRSTEAFKTLGSATDRYSNAMGNFNIVTEALSGKFSGLNQVLNQVKNPLVQLGVASMGVVGALMGYADNLRPMLQRGIGGAVMDFAIYAKSAGLTIQEFTKALETTGGAFVALGNTPTEAAKNFYSLINSVREATMGMGNLNMSQTELANWTAEQLKLSVQQGVRGRAAQERVIRLSRELGVEFQNLSERTGKSITEIAQFATKLASDPAISNFINIVAKGNTQIAATIQKFGATMGATFGKGGEEMVSAAMKSIASGVPIVFTEVGSSMLQWASNYTLELQRQAQITARGGELTEADNKRLRDLLKADYESKREIIDQQALAGDAAAQRIQQMYQEMQQYEKDVSSGRRKQIDAERKAAQEFNAEMNKLRATMQQLAVPILKLINGVDWVFLAEVMNNMVDGFRWLMDKALAPLGKALGSSGLGKVIAGVLGAAAAFALIVGTITALGLAVKGVIGMFITLWESTKKFGGAIKSLWDLLMGKRTGGKTGGGKGPADIILDKVLGGGKLTRVSIEGGFGTSPHKPLFVVIVGQMAGKFGPRSGRFPMPVPTPDEGGPGVPPGQTPKGKRRPGWKTKIGGFFANWWPALFGGITAIVGTVLSDWGEERLKEDPDSMLGKVQKGLGKFLEIVGVWGGIIGQLLLLTPLGKYLAKMIPEFGNVLKWMKTFGKDLGKLVTSKMIPGILTALKFMKNSIMAFIAMLTTALKSMPIFGRVPGSRFGGGGLPLPIPGGGKGRRRPGRGKPKPGAKPRVRLPGKLGVIAGILSALGLGFLIDWMMGDEEPEEGEDGEEDDEDNGFGIDPGLIGLAGLGGLPGLELPFPEPEEKKKPKSRKRTTKTVPKIGSKRGRRGTRIPATPAQTVPGLGFTRTAGKPTPEIADGRGGARAVKGLGALGILFGAYQGYQEYKDIDDLERKGEISKAQAREEKAGVVGGTVGGVAGGAGGAAVGAAIGTAVLPLVGTVIGGILGGILGGTVGQEIGEAAGKGVAKVTEESKKDVKSELEGATSTAAMTREELDKENIALLKKLNQNLESLKDESVMNNQMTSRYVMSSESHERYLRFLASRPA